jgi:hypothetical protein
MTSLSLFDLPAISTKICATCKQEKSLSEFGNEIKRIDGKNIYCKQCFKVYKVRWLSKNKEKANAATKAWQENNKERARESARKWERNNKDKVKAKRIRMYEKHKEKRLAYAKQVKLENREFYTQLERLRCAKRSQAFPKWANREKMNAIYREARRLEKEDGIQRHVDHIIPLVHPLVSGLHCEFNLEILKAAENMAKHNHFEIEEAA